jgi:hypothetical protein
MRHSIFHIARRGASGRVTARPELGIALFFGLVMAAPTAHGASIVPSETFCEYGCEFPEFQQLVPTDEPSLPMLENPLHEISPFQDFLGEVDDTTETDSDSEWQSPSRGTRN